MKNTTYMSKNKGENQNDQDIKRENESQEDISELKNTSTSLNINDLNTLNDRQIVTVRPNHMLCTKLPEIHRHLYIRLKV